MNDVKHYLHLEGQQKGPFTLSQLQGMWRNGAITSETLHFMDGYSEWMPLDIIVPDLDPPVARAVAQAMPQQPVVIAKSRGIYILLGLFFLGVFGAHNFYAGRYGVASVQLIVTILTGWLILPLLAVAIWVVIECIIVTVDGNGNKMS